MTHLLYGHELNHLLGVQAQNVGLILVDSTAGIQLSDTLSHKETLLHCLMELHTHTKQPKQNSYYVYHVCHLIQ